MITKNNFFLVLSSACATLFVLFGFLPVLAADSGYCGSGHDTTSGACSSINQPTKDYEKKTEDAPGFSNDPISSRQQAPPPQHAPFSNSGKQEEETKNSLNNLQIRASQNPNAGYYGLDEAASPAGLNSKQTTVPEMIGKVVGAVLSFLGIAFFILIIYAGFRWMFARGNDQEVAKAKDIIVSAVIGLVIVLSAYAITFYIGGLLSGK